MQVLAGAVYSPCLFLHVEFLLCFCFLFFVFFLQLRKSQRGDRLSAGLI